jgi:hypothetical protein
MPSTYKTVRLPKATPPQVRNEFVAMVAATRSTMSLDRAIASVGAQVDRVGTVDCPISICADLHQLVEPYVVKHRRPNKQKPPQA